MWRLGYRSYDRTMPEETNRVIEDYLSDYYFTPSTDADENLKKEGIHADQIFFVGNVMIDTLINFLPKAEKSELDVEVTGEYGLVTLHRPSNVDDEKNLLSILNALTEISKRCKLIFPIHPRTRSKIKNEYLENSGIKFIEPQGYLAFLKLQKGSKFVITDSGGIQEETTYLGIPCFTLRNNTERPITQLVGTNTLVGTDLKNLLQHLNSFFDGNSKKSSIPELWDGQAAKRIAKIVYELLYKNQVK